MISLDFDVRAFLNHVTTFLRSSIGKRVAIFGLSGGLDSTTVAYLLARSVPKERVLAVLMHEDKDEDYYDALDVVHKLGINHVKRFLKVPDRLSSDDKVTMGNVKARLRMIELYRLANKLGGVVVGTSNKSELMIGYFTKRGDGAADIYPIGDLYKTQVYKLAEYLGVPEKIIKKEPSAGLRPGQKDEKDIGLDYRTLDLILKGLEMFYTPKEISEELNVPLETVLRVRDMVMRSRHKRRKKILRASLRSPSFDRREPGYRMRTIESLMGLETLSIAAWRLSRQSNLVPSYESS